MTTANNRPDGELYQVQVSRPVFVIGRSLIKAFALLYFRARRRGRENYPEPPYLVAFNHSSNLDIVALSLAVTDDIVSAWAK